MRKLVMLLSLFFTVLLGYFLFQPADEFPVVIGVLGALGACYIIGMLLTGKLKK